MNIQFKRRNCEKLRWINLYDDAVCWNIFTISYEWKSIHHMVNSISIMVRYHLLLFIAMMYELLLFNAIQLNYYNWLESNGDNNIQYWNFEQIHSDPPPPEDFFSILTLYGNTCLTASSHDYGLAVLDVLSRPWWPHVHVWFICALLCFARAFSKPPL